MIRYNLHAWRGALGVLLGLGIAACGGRNDPPPPPDGGVVVIPRQEDQFGVRFGAAFRADNNSEPFSPADGDISAVSFTAEPIEIK